MGTYGYMLEPWTGGAAGKFIDEFIDEFIGKYTGK